MRPEDKLLFLKWKDKPCVTMISNAHSCGQMRAVSRRLKDGKREDIPCRQVIKDCNAHMGHVYKADMLKPYYKIDRKSKEVVAYDHVSLH